MGVIMTIYLVRHGKDDDTFRGGWSNHGLLPIGIKQVYALAKEIAITNIHVDCIYSSDIQRAAETAEILSNCLGCPIEYVPKLREVDNGILAGMENNLADERYPGLYWSTLDYDECYPYGESPEMFYNRIKAAWLGLKNRRLKQATKDALLVTHGGVIEAILCVENNVLFSNKTRHFSAPNAKLIPIEIS